MRDHSRHGTFKVDLCSADTVGGHGPGEELAMGGWGLFWVGLGTTAYSLWYARRGAPLASGAS